jgi:hypothetical protein
VRTLLLLSAFAAAGLRAQTPIHMEFNDPRPLAAAIAQLEKKLGIPINYEDPRFACPTEIQEVTDQVQSPAQRAANPNAHIIVPRHATLSFDYVPPSFPGDVLALLTQLCERYESKGYPGRFTVKQVGRVPTVEPNAARRADCVWAAATPVMETRIGFPAQTRNASEALQLIFETLTRTAGVKVGIASLPILGFVYRSVTLGAGDEPAGEVLMRLFEQLSVSTRSNYSYTVLYDPGVKYYMASIDAVQPAKP